MEDTKSQVTLIKHVVTQTAPKEETAPAPVEQKAPEKRKIVIVKKKVVVAKKPQPVSAGVPQETEKAEGSQMTEPQQPQTQQVQQQPVVRRNVVRQTTNSPLHNGPMIIHPTNLPPVPGQGQSVKDHVPQAYEKQMDNGKYCTSLIKLDEVVSPKWGVVYDDTGKLRYVVDVEEGRIVCQVGGTI